MKRTLSLIPILLLAGCYPTRIVTVTPYSGSAETYSTTVSVPRTNTVTTTTQVYASSYDISMDLDLQAVAAAFGQASNVREFEYLLNNSSYIISNLDLNRDGFVDYLRVVETLDGFNHLFVIQAVLADNVYQDVATVVVENPHLSSFHVEIIGAPYIYGPSFFIRPIFHTKPCIFAHFCMRDYHPWVSPWYWDHYPSCYHKPQPVYLSHYQAYVATYMSNSRYCHRVEYPSVCHYERYDDMTRGLQRNDFGALHPERSFTTRTANNPDPGMSALERSRQASTKPYNAQDIREAQATRSSSTTRSESSAGRTGSGSQTRSGNGSSTGRTGGYGEIQSRSGNTSSTGRTGNYGGTQSRSGNGSSTGRSGAAAGTTTVNSRVNNSGSSNTSTRTVSPSGNSTTVRRGSSAATRSTGSDVSKNNSRSESTGGTRSGSAASSGSSRSGAASSSGSTRSGSTASSGNSSSRSSTSSSSRTSGGSGSARR